MINSLKVGLSPCKKNLFICFNDSLSKIMKNAFYFILKALFVLKIFNFLSWLYGNVKNSLIRKIILISKFMTSQPVWQRITIHILYNILQSKSNQTMKSGQILKYNKENIFLQKSCRKRGTEASSRSLLVF